MHCLLALEAYTPVHTRVCCKCISMCCKYVSVNVGTVKEKVIFAYLLLATALRNVQPLRGGFHRLFDDEAAWQH